jgi:hypothetical protein
MPKEQRPFGAFTPEPNCVRERADGGGMTCSLMSRKGASVTTKVVAPRMKHPPKYIRSRLYFSAFM